MFSLSAMHPRAAVFRPSDGKIRTGLFSRSDHDSYGVIQRGGGDAEMAAFHRAHDSAKGSPPPHRRARLLKALARHGPHRRLTVGLRLTTRRSSPCKERHEKALRV